MAKIIEVKPSEDFRLYVKYSDGLDGFIDMKKMLKHEEYKSLNDPAEFMKVGIDPKTKDIVWECGATMCKVAAYGMLKLKSEMKALGLDPDK